ncbi:MAG TPA: hypothetical protein VFI22_07110, partial [Thermomicrobiales bacterium]|nr:hypothetical protein [Thermomicrobiales bacterium]
MIERPPQPARVAWRRAISRDGLWLGLMAAFALFVSIRLGLWSPWANAAPGGPLLPNGFATVDHPFHAARAWTLLQTLRDGGILRWIDDLQGGYPVEFYPLGAAWLDAGVWAASLGALPIAAAHSIGVAIVLLAPAVPFALLARRDGLPLVVALLAIVAEVVIPGGRYGGGYTELVQWGLVTNVGAAVALLFAFAWSLAWVEDGSLAALAGAGLAGGLSLVTNPRSFLAFGASGVGILLASRVRSDGRALAPLR